MAVAVLLPRTALLGAPREVLIGWLPDRVTDERAIFFVRTGLFRDTHPEGAAGHPWAREAVARRDRGERLFTSRSVGFAGFYAGPSVHIVDEFALCDPLLARLPARPQWSPGHFERALPKGYLATLDRSPNRIEPRRLAARYDRLAQIIRDPLFSLARLKAIVSWQLGPRRMFPADYGVTVATLAEIAAKRQGSSIKTKRVLKTGEQGLAIQLGKPLLLTELALSLGEDDDYTVALRKGHKVLWSERVERASSSGKGLRARTFTLPKPLQVDSLLIRGRRGDYRYQVGALDLRLASSSHK